MSNTRIYRSLVDSEGNAITGQSMVAVPSGESPDVSSDVVTFVEVQRSVNGVPYSTGEYYGDIPKVGIWDIYVRDTSHGVWAIYQESQWVGGIDLISGGYIGFSVYECISPVPNDGSYYLAQFPATGLDPSADISVVFPSPGISYDVGYGIQRDYTKGMITLKIKGAVHQGVHVVYFTQGGVEARTIFRVVDISSTYASPMYNFLQNPELSMGDGSNPTYWTVRAYLAPDLSGDTGAYETTMLAPTDPGLRMKLMGEDPTLSGVAVLQDKDVLYLLQTANIGASLVAPQIFTFSAEFDISNITDLSLQISMVAISRVSGADTILAETTANTITSTASGRALKTINAPIGTTHIRVVIALANNTGGVLPAAPGHFSEYIEVRKAKLSAGLDSAWYA